MNDLDGKHVLIMATDRFEESELFGPLELLREIWRVLAPHGRLMIVVPNRRGLWARVDTTPFGYGSPFSRRQLTRLLKEAMFSPDDWEYALHMPPFNWRILLKWPLFWERLGLLLWPTFSGVIVVEATKEVYAAIPARDKSKDFQPMKYDTVFVGPERKEVGRWSQMDSLSRLH